MKHSHPEVLLLTPGPTPIHSCALAALSWPMRGHMDPDVIHYNSRIMADLKRLYQAPPDSFTFLLSGTGSLAMEAGLANLLERGDSLLVASNGVFGERTIEMGRRLGASVTPVRFPAGSEVDVARVRAAAQRVRPKLIAMVHGETSTGVLNPVPAVGEVAAEVGSLYSVDAVTTVGMVEFDMARWGVDYAYTGSQKCLSAPPGVAPVALSARAMDVVRQRKWPVASWYSDVLGAADYWALGGGESRYHHTVPVQLHWATGEAIRAALAEGIAARSQRVHRLAAALTRALAAVGFKPYVPEAYRLPTVLATELPPGLDDAAVRAALRNDYRISVTGGLGSTAGRIWRLGLMGEGAHACHYRELMVALSTLLAAPALADQFDEALAALPPVNELSREMPVLGAHS